jgi:hypothetical protein
MRSSRPPAFRANKAPFRGARESLRLSNEALDSSGKVKFSLPRLPPTRHGATWTRRGAYLWNLRTARNPKNRTCAFWLFWCFPDSLKIWWLDPESNWGHKDFQSSALPTELSSHKLQQVSDLHLTALMLNFDLVPTFVTLCSQP